MGGLIKVACGWRKPQPLTAQSRLPSLQPMAFRLATDGFRHAESTAFRSRKQAFHCLKGQPGQLHHHTGIMHLQKQKKGQHGIIRDSPCPCHVHPPPSHAICGHVLQPPERLHHGRGQQARRNSLAKNAMKAANSRRRPSLLMRMNFC